MEAMTLTDTLEDLKARFLERHVRKEDLFWAVKMGLADDPAAAQRDLAAAEVAANGLLQDPERLQRLRALEASGEGSDAERRVLRGWIDTLAAHTIESPEARELSQEIVEREGELERRRQAMELGFTDPETGRFERASSVKLGLMVGTDPDPARRRAAFEGLRSIEAHVLESGFLEIVRLRNRLGRMQGYEDYYDWRVSVVERMRKRELFAVLDDLAARTKERAAHELDRFVREKGEEAREPYNLPYLRSGALTREIDPYFSFAAALRRWGRSFAALGVRFRGATLTVDLVDRPGKYENGFMHGPEPAFFERGRWRPARINFTANAVPGAVGSGLRATQTLFHEGGHAAHFSNVLSDAPCFSHEFAPTSVAYAEMQSMLLDSLLGDADWRARYALDAEGRPMPWELIERSIRERQPFRAWGVRSMLTVPFAERAIYELPDDELEPARVLEVIRGVERELQGLHAGVRPVLSIPHLLSGESSAYYHGYVLALMAVHQARRHFLERDGHIVDNPRVGPELAERCWAPGNALPFDAIVRGLTGGPLAADALVESCDRSADEACERARAAIERLERVPRHEGPIELDASVRVVHGHEQVASTDGVGFEEACAAFERWVAAR